MAFDVSGDEAVLEEAPPDRVVRRQRNQALPYVPRRGDVERGCQATRGASVVGDGDDGIDSSRILLDPLQSLGQTVATAVRDYVFEHADAETFLERVNELLGFLIPRYEAEGKSYLTIGIGCTGGRHRSVALAEAIGAHLADQDVEVTVHHRDAGLSTDEAHRH